MFSIKRFVSNERILVDKKSQIVLAAQPLFSQFGLKKATTDDIAKRARISKATIYRYYRNKQEIFDDDVAYEANQLLSAITEAVKRRNVRKLQTARLFTEQDGQNAGAGKPSSRRS